MTALTWRAIREPDRRTALAALLLDYVRPRRWFRAKARNPSSACIADLVPLGPEQILAVLRIDYADGGADDLYAIPLARVSGVNQQRAAPALPAADAPPAGAIIAALGHGGDAAGGDGALVDGLLVPGLAADMLLEISRRNLRLPGDDGGVLIGEAMPPFAELARGALPPAKIASVEQTNSTATFGEQVLLKVYRQLTEGPNPELEMGRFLNKHCHPPCAPRVLGALSYRSPNGATFSLGIAHQYLSNAGDAFSFVVAKLRDAFDNGGRPPDGGFAVRAGTLGRRTGELHLALASPDPGDPNDGAFASEPLTADDRARAVARAEAMFRDQVRMLGHAVPDLSFPARKLAEKLLTPAAQDAITTLLRRFEERALDVTKTRIHGDLHLGQVLVRNDDFVIIDFEGEPARPLAERRAKSSPFRDVMGMVRSFAYAPEVVLRAEPYRRASGEERTRLQTAAAVWKKETAAAYLKSYLATVGDAAFVPRRSEDRQSLLTFYELEKVIYEVEYEMNNRPDWIEIPLRGLADLAGLAGPQGPAQGEGEIQP